MCVVVLILCFEAGVALTTSSIDQRGETIRFIKMHGLGNDYVYVDCFDQSLDEVDIPALARSMSDRHRGIGGDGLILIRPPAGHGDADVTMEMYNGDGSRGEMCGNGIRCVAKYAIEHGLVSRPDGETASVRVATDRGVLSLEATLRDGRSSGSAWTWGCRSCARRTSRCRSQAIAVCGRRCNSAAKCST